MNILKGGRAHLNGVTFYTERFIARAYSNGKVSIKERNSGEVSKWRKFMENTPFIRGAFLFLSLFLDKATLIFYISTLLPTYALLHYLSAKGETEKLNKFGEFMLMLVSKGFYLFLVILLLGFLFVRITKISSYHAAEHMAFNTLEIKQELNTENVKKVTRVSEHCGSNFVIFTVVIFALLYHVSILLNFVSAPVVALSMILSFSVGCEIFMVKSGILYKLVSPFYWIGNILQYTLLTAKPTTEQIEVAIRAIEALQQRENETINESVLS